MHNPQPRHWAMLAFLSLFWGFAFYLIAVGLESFAPFTLVNLRLAIGAATLYAVMRCYGYSLPTEPVWWWRFLLLSILGNLLPFTLISWAETRISSAQAGLLMALMPITTMVLAHFYVHGDSLTPRRIAGVLLGLAGVVVLIGGDVLSGIGAGHLIAQLAVLLSTLAYAVNSIYTKRIPQINTLVVATGSLILGTVLLLPFTLVIDRPWTVALDSRSLMAVVVLGVFSTGLATWVYFKVVSDCGPSFLSIINYVIPVLAFGAGVLLLNEPAQPSQFVGLVAICIGIALTQNRRARLADS
ncbi:MAG: DMT family transporter [Halioglobus sp.]